MTHSPAPGWRGFVVLMLVPLAMSVLMVVLGWGFTLSHGGRPAVKAMILAQVVLLVVVYSALLPMVRRFTAADAATRLKLAMRAGGQRFLVTLLAVAVILVEHWAERRPFLIWIGMGYVVMTLAETIALARWLGKTENPR